MVEDGIFDLFAKALHEMRSLRSFYIYLHLGAPSSIRNSFTPLDASCIEDKTESRLWNSMWRVCGDERLQMSSTIITTMATPLNRMRPGESAFRPLTQVSAAERLAPAHVELIGLPHLSKMTLLTESDQMQRLNHAIRKFHFNPFRTFPQMYDRHDSAGSSERDTLCSVWTMCDYFTNGWLQRDSRAARNITKYFDTDDPCFRAHRHLPLGQVVRIMDTQRDANPAGLPVCDAASRRLYAQLEELDMSEDWAYAYIDSMVEPRKP